MHQVWDTITQFHMLQAGDRVLIGVSGGPDSVALLHLLYSKAERYGISLYVVHVHHMLRDEADVETQYVETVAKQYGLPFRLYKVDVAEYAKVHKLSLEQAGHVVRFQCFRDAKSIWGINKLALGHHRDDRAESVLLHMIQGCGLDGLTAMPPVDLWDVEDDSRLIRPLAQVSKDALLQYCKIHGLQYFIDATNLESNYLRNRIRLELLPTLNSYNPQIADTLVRLQDSAGADLDYIETQVQMLWKQHGTVDVNAVQFPAEVFRMQHIALQRRLLRCLYQQWTGSTANLSFAQIEQMRKIAMQTEGSQMISLTNQTIFLRQYHMLAITTGQEREKAPFEILWDMDTQPELQIWNGVLSVQIDMLSESNDNDLYTVFADADQLAQHLVVRTRKPGDELTLSGTKGHKTVKKFFIDKKVPQLERDQLPILLSDNEIVWIPGYYINDRIKITDKTTRICKLYFSP